jgi:hypothetical protein
MRGQEMTVAGWSGARGHRGEVAQAWIAGGFFRGTLS